MQFDSYLGLTQLGFHRVITTLWGDDRKHPPIFCVHGLTRNGRDFDRLAEALSPVRHLLCPDMVGRGQSDWLSDPTLYSYATYMNDLTALIAKSGAHEIDWIGTSMGGLLGMMLAAQPHTPLRKLVINDVGPYIALSGLQRIASYVGLKPEFSDLKAAERYMRTNYAPFGITRDEDWSHMAHTSTEMLPNGRMTLAHDPSIAQNFLALTKDVDLWSIYDRIKIPTLLLRGANSDILSSETAHEMTKRGPHAQLITFQDVGHAPALVDTEQINVIRDFLCS